MLTIIPRLAATAVLLFGLSDAAATTTLAACPASSNTLYKSYFGTTFQIACGTDYNGGNMRVKQISTFQMCVDTCGVTEGCVAVSYSGDFCYLKNQLRKGLPNNNVSGAKLNIPSAKTAIGNFSSLGCYNDTIPARALHDKRYYGSSTTKDMTEELCAATCKGYTYFGVEFGQECFCGNALNNGSTKAPETDCKTTCPGDETELCGGRVRLNVFKYNATLAAQGGAS